MYAIYIICKTQWKIGQTKLFNGRLKTNEKCAKDYFTGYMIKLLKANFPANQLIDRIA